MMRKLENQNSSLGAELSAQRNMKALRKQQQQKTYTSRTESGNLSQHNLKLLMKSYEKKAREAEDRISQLEKELNNSKDFARRYHDMYTSERDKATTNPGSNNTSNRSKRVDSSPSTSQDRSQDSEEKEDDSSHEGTENSKEEKEDVKNDNKSNSSKTASQTRSASSKSSRSRGDDQDKVMEDDLDDDKAKFKRHVARITESKSMLTTAPIRVEDVIRKNEVLLEENETLRREVQRLKWDNGQLIKKVKQSSANQDKLLHEISTSESARKDLSKRLEKEQKEKQKLSHSLNRQAADWVQFKRNMLDMDDMKKLAMLRPIQTSESGSEERTYTHAAKKNVYMPRKMHPVEEWSRPTKST